MNNLEPRAKIGDVVMIRGSNRQWLVDEAELELNGKWCYGAVRGWCHMIITEGSCIYKHLDDKDILKNLTTNISYE